MADWREQCPPKWRDPANPFKTHPGEGSASPPTYRQTAWGLVTPNARDTFAHIDPIHLPSQRGEETPVAFLGPLVGSFFIPTLMMIVSTAVVCMQGGLTIQALDVIEGAEVWGTSPHMMHPWEGSLALLTLNPSASVPEGFPGPDHRSHSLFLPAVGTYFPRLGDSV